MDTKSMERNVSDFEKALKVAREAIEAIEGVVDEDLVGKLKGVHEEWRNHLSVDVEEAINFIDEHDDG